MSFLYPLGLLGLIGIPILIIIYIIKNKYTEQTIASTYIWKLSERFLKRKKPISKLRGLISLILQCLIVLFLSFLISSPSLIIKGGASDYCFIVDGSASMNKKENGNTRFNLAKDEVEKLISESKMVVHIQLFLLEMIRKFFVKVLKIRRRLLKFYRSLRLQILPVIQ